MSRFRRVFLIILDGVGVGSAPDADKFGDAGSDTLRHIAEATKLKLPTMARLGLGRLYGGELEGLNAKDPLKAVCCRLTEISAAKDSTTGHWEMMGIVRTTPSPTFPKGFPKEFIAAFEEASGHKVIGNKVASGTVIIQELGAKHLETGALIVYTSADSVLQIAAHKEVVPLDELYSACTTAREMLTGELAVDRVIARPFVGNRGDGFIRTTERRDFSQPPPQATVLDRLKDAGRDVIALGKVRDLFAGRGFTHYEKKYGNAVLMNEMSDYAAKDWQGLLFCNLVDFDTLFGHRNNIEGFAIALREFDTWLGTFLPLLKDDDLLMITADHGNDPSTPSTDHSREQVPLLIYSTSFKAAAQRIEPEPGFTHVGRTIACALGADSEDIAGDNLLGEA